ncbi:hypothetical protein U1Q18_051350 [Sarracenia purpurea var. burkii]
MSVSRSDLYENGETNNAGRTGTDRREGGSDSVPRGESEAAAEHIFGGSEGDLSNRARRLSKTSETGSEWSRLSDEYIDTESRRCDRLRLRDRVSLGTTHSTNSGSVHSNDGRAETTYSGSTGDVQYFLDIVEYC